MEEQLVEELGLEAYESPSEPARSEHDSATDPLQLERQQSADQERKKSASHKRKQDKEAAARKKKEGGNNMTGRLDKIETFLGKGLKWEDP